MLLSQGNCFSGTRHRERRGANMPVVTASPGLLRRRHCHLIRLGLPLRFSSHFLGKRAQAPLPPSSHPSPALLLFWQWDSGPRPGTCCRLHGSTLRGSAPGCSAKTRRAVAATHMGHGGCQGSAMGRPWGRVGPRRHVAKQREQQAGPGSTAG